MFRPPVLPVPRRLAVAVAAAAVAAAAVAAAGLASAPVPAGAADACVSVRTYGFAGVSVDRAWASTVGGVMTDTGNEQYALAITDRIAQYVDESLAGGCTPTVAFATRATTGKKGQALAFFQGSATVGGGPVSGSVDESGGHPLGECHVYTCFAINDHEMPLTGQVGAGSELTVSGTSFAMAMALIPNRYNQAHADWRVQFPVLRVPIP